MHNMIRSQIWNGGETPQTVNLVGEVDVAASVNCFARMAHPKYPAAIRLCTGAGFGTITVWDQKVIISQPLFFVFLLFLV
jgi:hypothetical protein